MKAKLLVEGKEFDIEILDPELQKLLAPNKKTGYERVELDNTYYYDDCNGSVCNEIEEQHNCDNISYDGANYYSDQTVAENNARADNLMRQLRRFAVEHRAFNVPRNECMYSIAYRIFDNNVKLCPNKMINCHYMDIWFDTEDVAWQAINMFYNELIWYFTEYKDSL